MAIAKKVCRVESYHCYPNLSRAAIKAGLFKRGLRYWYVAHEALGNRRTYTQPQLRALLELNFDISERYSHKIVADGRGIFWTLQSEDNPTTAGTIRISPPFEVARALGVTLGTYNNVSVEQLKSSNLRQVFKHLKDTSEGNSSSPLGRDTLEALVGVGRRAQQWYDLLNGERCIRCDELVQLFSYVDEAKLALEQGLGRGVYKHRQFSVIKTTVDVVNPDLTVMVGSGGSTIDICGIVKRIGNMYECVPLRSYVNPNRAMLGAIRNSKDRVIWAPTTMLPDLGLRVS